MKGPSKEQVLMVQPKLIRRDRDLGYLAITPDGFGLRFAVVGDTEAEARKNFDEAKRGWASLRPSDDAWSREGC